MATSTIKAMTIEKVTITPSKGTSYAPWDGCYYEKYGRLVHLHFGVSGLTQGTGNVIYTLPEELRPHTLHIAIGGGQTSSHYGQLQVTVAGTCTFYPNGNTYALVDAFYLV